MSEFHEQLHDLASPSQQLEQYIEELVARQEQPGEPIVRYHGGRAEDIITITPGMHGEDPGYYIDWTTKSGSSNGGTPLGCWGWVGEVNRGFLPQGGAFSTLRDTPLPQDYNHESMARTYVSDALPFSTEKPRGPLGRILLRKFGV